MMPTLLHDQDQIKLGSIIILGKLSSAPQCINSRFLLLRILGGKRSHKSDKDLNTPNLFRLNDISNSRIPKFLIADKPNKI